MMNKNMHKIIVFIVFSICVANGQYPTYNETYTRAVFDLAASAYPTYSTQNGQPAIDACLSKAYSTMGYNSAAIQWHEKQTYTITCGMANDNNDCQMLIAISTQPAIVVIAFRGTIGASQFLNELKDSYDMVQAFDGSIRVDKYFYQSMQNMWTTVEGLVSAFPNYKIIITGHSLGGALASLTAAQIAYTIPQLVPNIQLITFGEPRVGDSLYGDYLRKNINYMFRVVHGSDPIPHLPFCVRNSASGCSSDNTNEYYQHPQEIWYHGCNLNDTQMGSTYEVCSPTDGEDNTCSNSLSDINFVFQDGGLVHTHYFDHDISTYGLNSCDDESTVANYYHPRNTISKDCHNSASIIQLNFLTSIALFIRYFLFGK